jgi:TusA-related sulfurtransferase
MRYSNSNPVLLLALAVLGCASTRPPSSSSSSSPAAAAVPETAAQVCAGLGDDDRNASLCPQPEDIISVARIPIEVRNGEVLTGARMVVRATPGRTPRAQQQIIDCQLARAAAGEVPPQYPVMSYCPLAIAGVKAEVHEAPEGFVVDVKSNDPAVSHRISHTVAHSSAALQMERFESTECGGIAPRARAACPLLGPVTAMSDIPAGVRVEFVGSVSLDAVLAGMRCHYSFAQARGFTDEASACPLYVRGLHVARSADAKAIDITIAPPSKVGDIRRRVREEAVFAGGRGGH